MIRLGLASSARGVLASRRRRDAGSQHDADRCEPQSRPRLPFDLPAKIIHRGKLHLPGSQLRTSPRVVWPRQDGNRWELYRGRHFRGGRLTKNSTCSTHLSSATWHSGRFGLFRPRCSVPRDGFDAPVSTIGGVASACGDDRGRAGNGRRLLRPLGRDPGAERLGPRPSDLRGRRDDHAPGPPALSGRADRIPARRATDVLAAGGDVR
jgi:hypothetical protein